jgi:hypothetical protein
LKQIVKKYNWLYIVQVLTLVAILSAPAIGLAQLRINDPTLCQGTGLNCNAQSPNELIRTVINWLLGVTFGVAILFLIIGGFRVITSGGNPDGQAKGKNTIINAVIGIIIIVLSYVIVNVVANFVSGRNGTTAP